MSLAGGLGLALVAFVVSALGVAAWRRIAQAYAILDVPNARSSHDRPTPRGGGFLIPIVVLAALVFSAQAKQAWGAAAIVELVAAVTLVALVSFWDDLRGVSTPVKMVTHLSAAGLSIAAIAAAPHACFACAEKTSAARTTIGIRKPPPRGVGRS